MTHDPLRSPFGAGWTLRLALSGSLVCGALLCAPEVRAMDPRLPLLAGEPDAASKVERFAQATAHDARLQAALRAAAGAPARDRIHRALLAVPAYAAAVAGYEATGDNVAAWEALLATREAQDRFLRAHATYFLGRALLARDDLDGAAEALEAVRGRLREGTPWSDEATLYLAYAYARIPELDGQLAAANKTRAGELLGDLLGGEGRPSRYADAPERVREGADWLLRELRGEGMGPLLELAKRMETIERLIRRTTTGEPTQVRQEQVVATIDRLIELMRDKEQDGSCNGQGQQQGKPSSKRGNPGGQRSQSGAKESKLPNGDGKEGPLGEGPRRATADAWGDMKEREREEAVQYLRERFPTRYRELIERYYRAIAEGDR